VRVALINEGIYPYRTGSVSTWCHRLVRGLAEHEYHVVALVDSVTERLYPPLASTRNLTTMRVDGPSAGPPPGGHPAGERRLATHAAVLLCRGMLEDSQHGAAMFRSGLQQIAAGSAGGGNPLSGVSLPTILLDAWAAAAGGALRRSRTAMTTMLLPRIPTPAPASPGDRPTEAAGPRSGAAVSAGDAARGAEATGSATEPTAPLSAQPAPHAPGPRPPAPRPLPQPPALPRPSMAAARAAAALLDLALRPLSAGLPTVDLCQAVDSGMSIMVALAAKWRTGTPYLFTEHNPYPHNPLLRRARTNPAVYALILRFLQALTQLGYAEAAAIVPPSERMRRWALDHGAARELVTMIPPGVDPRDVLPLRQEPAEPVVAWVGPDRERELILSAFRVVREEVPQARLIVSGHPPEGSRPTGASFTGPMADRRTLYEMAQVVAVSGNDAGMPYPLIEAMMCGRPTICTESGGLATMVGIGAVMVGQNDPEALGRACVTLLRDERLRREISNSARQRARSLFNLRSMIEGYQRVYEQAVANAAAVPAQELVPSAG
jgi:glycosyltransferase involved in cell wall biosynthesis